MNCMSCKPPSDRSVRSPITIGFFIGSINYSFHYEMLSGIHCAASKYGVNLFCFLGRTLNSPDLLERPANIAYELARPEVLDGLIIAAPITAFGGDSKLLDRYCCLPLVVIADKFDGIASVGADNESGFRELLSHLIHDHGYRRLAFIGGSEDTVDARERYNIYRTVLAENDISFDSDLITSGRFSQEETAAEAVKVYLDQRKTIIDVIVAANDVLAKGALEELHSREIKVPDDIAVTGFDDQNWAKYLVCPLTTVHQSVYDMGKRGVELLLGIISGKSAPQNVFVPTKLITRNSCGCFPPSIAQITVKSGKNIPGFQDGTAKVDLNTWSKLIAPAMIEAIGGEDNPDRIREAIMQLIDSFITDILNCSDDNFLKTLQGLIQKLSRENQEFGPWQNVITAMQQFGLSYFGTRSNMYLAENLWHQARLIIGEAIIQAELNRNYQVLVQTLIFHTTSQMMAMGSSLSDLVEGMFINLPKLGIGNCYLSLYEEPERPDKTARLILAFRERLRIPLPPEGVSFSTYYLAPAEMLPKDKCYLLGVFPLYFGSEQLGLLVMDINTIERYFYNSFICEILCGIIAGAIKRVLIFEKLQKQEQLLNERTASLTRVNQELEQFAVIISQDLQQPLCALAVYLHLIENHYKGKIDAGADEFINFAVDGVARMSDLINNLLEYSRVNNIAKPSEKVDVNQILETVKVNLKVAIEEHQATVIQGNMPEITADSGQMIQLFQNLIGNAIKFHDQEPPVVRVDAVRDGEDWLFTVQDNGIGLDMQYADRIFMIFQRLHSKKDYPGTGIGLSVCKKIVERYGGRIWVESKPGRGTIFYFTIRSGNR